MSTSSGVRVYEIERPMICGAEIRLDATEHPSGEIVTSCDFEGVVEVGIDPEISVAMWVCPECNTEHPIEWEDLS